VVLAREHGARTIALPLVRSGLRGYPLEAAARVAVQTLAGALAAKELPERAILCAFTSEASAALRAAWSDAAEAVAP
jgi:O-acetyl-ADP-ribose deacetylase (regulator of RNase III)